MTNNPKLLAIYISVEAIKVEVEGMKQENAERAANDRNPAYDESHFWAKARDLDALSKEALSTPPESKP